MLKYISRSIRLAPYHSYVKLNMKPILHIQLSITAFPALWGQPQYSTYNKVADRRDYAPSLLYFVISFFSHSLFSLFHLSCHLSAPLPSFHIQSPLLSGVFCLSCPRLSFSVFEILLCHWWKPTAASKIASVLARGLKGEITANEWSDNHRLRRGRWRDGQMAQSSSETTCYRKDHSSTPPTCSRERKMLSFCLKHHRQMKQKD